MTQTWIYKTPHSLSIPKSITHLYNIFRPHKLKTLIDQNYRISLSFYLSLGSSLVIIYDDEC